MARFQLSKGQRTEAGGVWRCARKTKFKAAWELPGRTQPQMGGIEEKRSCGVRMT